MERRRLALSRLALALAAILLVVSACGPHTMGADLAKLPEASIAFPGSTLRNSGLGDAGVESQAFCFRMYDVDAEPAAIGAFYKQQLADLGWTNRAPKYPEDEAGYFFTKGPMTLSIIFPSTAPHAVIYTLEIRQE